MCWITLAPKPKRHHHGHHHHHHSDNGSSVAELVRVHQKGDGPRYSKIRIIAPVHELEKHDHDHLGHHHHHHHPHMHPLHMHPIHHHAWKMHGTGKKRSPAPPPPPSAPPPSRSPSSCPEPREPTYRTKIVEPATREVRETTRVALREVRPERGRLRRVAGYEVLGKEVPWDWDCVSSVVSGGGGSRRGDSRLRYPPFGTMDRWM
ncbi:hypothetical protein BU23DRAFT_98569 [Bimuria novae-zelandiae CBS 107.79]|uniref:Uncharacterized protein n=1 Tax=Bimuria novae-zelandiae CBS 107.79 TaxID=1447943 RepID=A0A6A5W225_9PLEO|nr:hypothetical protein BU23DRAFT_98569 [Bimuria novae-zelandiae CBS 107.79]